MIMDFWQRPAADLGQAGPDKGQGGEVLRHRRAGADKPPQVDGHFIVQCKTNNVFIGIRVLEPGEDKIKAAMERYRIYPYAQRNIPPQFPCDNATKQIVEPDATTGHAVLAKALTRFSNKSRSRSATA